MENQVVHCRNWKSEKVVLANIVAIGSYKKWPYLPNWSVHLLTGTNESYHWTAVGKMEDVKAEVDKILAGQGLVAEWI